MNLMSENKNSTQSILKNLVGNSDILDTLNDGVYIVDHSRRIIYWNPAAEKITGFTSEQVVGKRCMDNILTHITKGGCYICRKGCPLSAVIEDGQKHEIDVYLHHHDGYRIPVHVKGNPIFGSNGKVVACVEVFRGSSPTQTLKDKISQINNTSLLDPTSGLPNRTYLEKMLKIKLGSGKIQGIIHLTLNQPVQLTAEQDIHLLDCMIHVMGQTLAANCNPADTACRFNQTSMMVIVEDTDPAKLQAKADELMHVLCCCTYNHDGKRIPLSITVGTTMTQPGDTLQQLQSRMVHSTSLPHYHDKPAA